MFKVTVATMLFGAFHSAAAELQTVRVSDDGSGFVLSESEQPFVPWGFNYDHDQQGSLIVSI